MSRKLYSFIKYLIGWPLSLIALIFIFKTVFLNASQMLPKVSQINFLFLFLSLAFFIIYFFLRSFLWKYLLGDKGKQFSFKQNALFWSMSEIKRYVPGSIWSFMSRADSFSKNDLSKKEIGAFLVHEAVILCISSLLFSWFYLVNFKHNQYLSDFVSLIILFSVIIFVFGNKFLNLINTNNGFTKILNFLLPSQSAFVNFKALLLGTVTFFFFGVGTYFCLTSLFYVDIKYILDLISLFIFSFFIGYISLITPMGLGVREATMTVGLTSFLTTTASALVSIFSRAVFIIAELISLLIIVVWNKLNFKFFKKVEEFVYKYRYEIILIIFVIIYIGYFSITSFLRYDNFYTGRFDLGNMDQTVWNTIHGRIFQLTDPDGTNNISRLSVHADFILILISPLYLIWSNPKMLLLLQTIVLGFGAFFVYLISENTLKNKNISLSLSAAYLLNPAIGFASLYDFHPVTLATTFLLAAYYFFSKKKYLFFLVFAVLAGLTKEELWAVLGIFGLFIAVKELKNKTKINWRNVSFGIFIFLAGGLASYLLISKIIPFVKGSDHFALSYYSDFGNSASGILKGIILNPIKTISTLLEHSRLIFLSQLLMPLGYLSLLSPVLLIFAIPDLLVDLLSNNPQLHQIYYQYAAVITPFIFISAIYSCLYLVKKIKQINFEHLAIYIILAALFSAYFTGPLPGSLKPNIDMYSNQLVNSGAVNNFLSLIPKKYSISATNNLGSHLSRRQNIYTIPNGMDKADVIVLLLNHGFSGSSDIVQTEMVNNLKKDSRYTLLFTDKDFVAFAKKSAAVHLRKIKM